MKIFFEILIVAGVYLLGLFTSALNNADEDGLDY